MTSADVRAGLASYFENAAIPGLHEVHRAPPFWADGGEWQLKLNLGAAAVGAIHLIEDSESRISLPAVTGQKLVKYEVALMLFYQWLVPSGGLSKVDAADWCDALDAIIDGCKALIRADPNCADYPVLYQVGQDANDLHIIRDIPRTMPGKVLSWNALEFSAYEVITA